MENIKNGQVTFGLKVSGYPVQEILDIRHGFP